MDINNELSYVEFIQRENNLVHAPYGEELSFYEAVKSGNLEMITKFCKSNNLADKKGFGKLSNDPIRNIRYHFIITVSLIARYCIEGGMNHQVAYSLSDFYIQKADIYKSIKLISELHETMVIDYTKKMKQLKKNKICSKPISRSIDYIYNNLHTRITLRNLADYVNLNSSYLSKLFKMEVGIPISKYIIMKKIETAQNMLKYSNYTASEIASILAFPTQSYFTEVFKKMVGMTPKKYCNRYFREFLIINKTNYNN
jgi:AraC family transcriptional regulator